MLACSPTPHPPHMSGVPVDLGECGLISKKNMEGGGGTWAHDSMRAPRLGVVQLTCMSSLASG